jgi:hypothetical protein
VARGGAHRPRSVRDTIRSFVCLEAPRSTASDNDDGSPLDRITAVDKAKASFTEETQRCGAQEDAGAVDAGAAQADEARHVRDPQRSIRSRSSWSRFSR